MSQLDKNNSFDVGLSFKVGLRVLIIGHSLISSNSLSPPSDSDVKSSVCLFIKMCRLIFDAFTNVGFRVLPVLGEIQMCFVNLTFWCLFNTNISRIASTTFEKIHYFGSQRTRRFVFKHK